MTDTQSAAEGAKPDLSAKVEAGIAACAENPIIRDHCIELLENFIACVTAGKGGALDSGDGKAAAFALDMIRRNNARLRAEAQRLEDENADFQASYVDRNDAALEAEDRATAAEAALSTVTAERDRLREALEPFLDAAAGMAEIGMPDEAAVLRACADSCLRTGTGRPLTFGHFRRLRAALTAGQASAKPSCRCKVIADTPEGRLTDVTDCPEHNEWPEWTDGSEGGEVGNG